MNPVIQTARLVLRPFLLSDAAAFYEMNADPEVIRFTGDQAFEDVDAARNFIAGYKHYADHGFGRWAVIRAADQAFIGFCGLKMNEEGVVDLGFRFFRHEWRKGYATEAAQACLRYGFEELGMEEIIGRAAADNGASIRVLEKLGMEFWKADSCEGIEGAHYFRIHKDRWIGIKSTQKSK